MQNTNTPDTSNNEPVHTFEVSPDYVKKMQEEGMWAAMKGDSPEFPICPHYMSGYNSIQ